MEASHYPHTLKNHYHLGQNSQDGITLSNWTWSSLHLFGPQNFGCWLMT